MFLEEIIEMIQYKSLNEKCNHYIFAGLKDSELKNIVYQIPSKTPIKNYTNVDFWLSDTKKIGFLSNVFVDIQKLEVQNLFNIILEQLQIKEKLSFVDRKSLIHFRGILRKYEHVFN